MVDDGVISDGVIAAVCPGKIGDIIHSLIALQKLSRIRQRKVYLFTTPDYKWISSLLDHLHWIVGYHFTSLRYTDPLLAHIKNVAGMPVDDLLSLSLHEKDPEKGWLLQGWWSNNFHSMDFFASCAGVSPLVGEERILTIDGLPSPGHEYVALLPNCGDYGQRGYPADQWDDLARKISDKIRCTVVTIGGGDILPTNTLDYRDYSLWEVVCAMRKARLIVSLDTFASANLAESVGTPIVRIHRGMCKASSTGPGIVDWDGHRWFKDPLHGMPATVSTIMEGIMQLWEWK